jgi:hypothetical protein
MKQTVSEYLTVAYLVTKFPSVCGPWLVIVVFIG